MTKRLPKLGAAAALTVSVLTAGAASADDHSHGQKITKLGSQASIKGPEKFFTGDARIDPLFPANETARYSGAYVTFEPGARSAWHLHPGGQHIIVTSGVGRTGTADGKIEEIKAGDVIWCPPGVKHWHGAAPDIAMTHLVVTGYSDGENVVWDEHVTDAQYKGE
ncbi:MAG: cupin domain-containing protein [Rhodospirillales bacterium]|nr:cupin domain-containing protein [Rhodospirillales bacterium]